MGSTIVSNHANVGISLYINISALMNCGKTKMSCMISQTNRMGILEM